MNARAACDAGGGLLERLAATGTDEGRTGADFRLVHAGRSSVAIGDLRAVARRFGASIPRTGHVGDWSAIARGQAGALDFNLAICGAGLGFAMVHAFTFTDTAEGGDRVYRPASYLDGPVRRPLRPLHWREGAWSEAAGIPLFCPFAQIMWDGGRLPLCAFHRRRFARLPGFGARLEAEMLWDDRARLRQRLVALLEWARDGGSRRALTAVIGKFVTPSGLPVEAPPSWSGDRLTIGGYCLGTAEQVAEAALLPFRAIAQPGDLEAMLRDAPAAVPVPSGLAMTLLSALATTVGGEGDAGPLHLHWGARDMAGYPPLRGGYLGERSNRDRLRAMARALARDGAEAEPVTMVLLPAAVFMLAANDREVRDPALVDQLLLALREQPADLAGAEKAVRAWLAGAGGAVSPYFLGRFRRRSPEPPSVPAAPGRPVLTDRFLATSVADACLLVGALHKVIGGDVPCA